MTSKYKDQPAFPVTSDNFANPQSTGMTVREYAAIQLKVPNSGTDWLDEMIRTAQRNELAAKAMQADFQAIQSHGKCELYSDLAERAYIVARAVQKASNV